MSRGVSWPLVMRVLEALLLFVCVDQVYLWNGRTTYAIDTQPARYLPAEIINHRDFYLDGFPFLYQRKHHAFLEQVDGHYVSAYPVAPALLAVPFYAPSVLRGEELTARRYEQLEKLTAASIVSASVVVLHAALRRLVGAGFALWITGIYAFGTSSLSISSQALWQHGPSQLMLAVVLYLIVRAREDGKWARFGGFPLAFAVICRPVDLLLAAPAALYIAFRHRRATVWLVLGAIPPMAFQLWYNVEYFGDPWRTQYPVLRGPLWNTPMWDGFAGLLFSPARGLLIYSPVLVFSLFALAAEWRAGGDWLLRGLGLGMLLTLLLYSRWYSWWGGETYGPRLLADLTPVLCFALCPLAPLVQRRRIVAVLLGFATLWSVGAHALGAVYGDPGWNRRSVSVDHAPERLWIWSDNELVNSAAFWLRDLRRWRGGA